jgi:glycosyltransferase involved in cell wall biosynthesis
LRIVGIAQALEKAVQVNLIAVATAPDAASVDPAIAPAFGQVEVSRARARPLMSAIIASAASTVQGYPLLSWRLSSASDLALVRSGISRAGKERWIEFQDASPAVNWAKTGWARPAGSVVGVSFLNLNLRGYGLMTSGAHASWIKGRASHFHARGLQKFERKLIARVDYAIVCSEADRRSVLGVRPELPCLTLPNGAQASAIVPVKSVPEPTAIFVGDLTYRPNLQGLSWFFDSAFPLVRKRFPDAKVLVCGRAPSPETVRWLKGISGVELHASPMDLGPFYRAARACIVPILSGGGSRLKIPEAMAWAVPVVSTSKGAEGLDLVKPSEIILADAPDAFADALVRLYGDDVLYEAIRDAGRQRVVSDYDWQGLGTRLAEFYRSLGLRGVT